MVLSKHYIGILFGIAGLFFIIGWIFPIEGPLDSTYDDFIKIKKSHQKSVGAKKPKKEVIILDEDEMELFYLIPSATFDIEGVD